MIEKRNVIFRYKGKRDYIHGTDMFNEIFSVIHETNLTNILFSVHDFIRPRSCEIYTTSIKEEITAIEGVKSRCQVNVDGETRWLALKENSMQTGDNDSRYEYDENHVISLCELREESISLMGHSPFTFIETVVAMNKRLLEELFPDANGKWVFTRIDLDFLSYADTNLCLNFKHNMNFRLVKSEIIEGGQKIGDIYFSLVKS